MQVFHVALASEWATAQRSGFYVTSTLGRSLADEGFIHAARGDQWEGVRRRYYSGVAEPLVLLAIDTDLLTSPWQEDPVGDDTFPHIYGPLNPDAVVSVVPLTPERPAAPATPAAPRPVAPIAPTDRPGPGAFRRAFVGEIVFRTAMALLIMALTAIGLLLAREALGRDWALLGAALGLAVAVVAVVRIGRLRARRTP